MTDGSPADSDGTSTASHLRVMTWNLWWRFGPWQARAPAIAATIAAQRPDVLLLQEVWSADGTSAAHRIAEDPSVFGDAHVAITDDPFGGRDVGFHNAIVSRWPIREVRSTPLPGADGAPGHRRVLTAMIETPWGSWPFASTHLEYRFHQSALRSRQTRTVLEAVVDVRGDPETSLPVIVGGDFNAVPDSDEIRGLTGRAAPPVDGIVLSDAWEHAARDAREGGDSGADGPTWRADNPYQAGSAWPNRRLDYVFVSWPRPKPVGNPVAAWLAGVDAVEGIWPSDHAAVVVDITVPDSRRA